MRHAAHASRFTVVLALVLPVVTSVLNSVGPSLAQAPPAFALYLPFITAPPSSIQLRSPANGETVATLIPELRWYVAADPAATRMRIEVARDSSFAQMPFPFPVTYRLTQGLTEGERRYELNSNLGPGTTYYWRVGLLYENAPAKYSDVWTFTTAPNGVIPAKPALLEPSDGSTVTQRPVVLRWHPVEDAVEYLVFIDPEDPTHSTVIFHAREAQLSPPAFILTDDTYRWWVQARTDYAYGPYSDTWTFILQSSP